MFGILSRRKFELQLALLVTVTPSARAAAPGAWPDGAPPEAGWHSEWPNLCFWIFCAAESQFRSHWQGTALAPASIQAPQEALIN